MEKLKVTIGIPAYNEEGNIKNLIEALLKQNQENFELYKIIVASDGSTDKTEEIVKSFHDSRVELIADGKRIGTAATQNQILDRFQEDLLLLINADVFPTNHQFIESMIAPVRTEEGIGIISCKLTPLPAENFFESVINFSVKFKNDLASKVDNINNLYNCHGAARLFTKQFLNNFRFAPVVSEDAYSYFACKQAGFKFLYVSAAEVLYRSPQSLHDHLRQSVRFFQGQKGLAKYISPEIVKEEHKIPIGIFIWTSFRYFIQNPILFLSYGAISLVSLVKTRMDVRYAILTWEPVTTSKILKK